MNEDVNTYDVVVVGGGPAGLQAAQVLARTRRSVLVFDDPAPPRNGAAGGVHNFIGLDGRLPGEVRAQAWKEISIYGGATLLEERVEDIARDIDDGFMIRTKDGSRVHARHVILAMGYHDVYPNIPGFVECWADTIIPCPFCDGYENRDRVWGIVATSEDRMTDGPRVAMNWTSKVKVIVPSGLAVMSQVEPTGLPHIDVHHGKIQEVLHDKGKLTGVILEGGKRVDVETLWWTLPERPSALAERLVSGLGLETDDAGYIATDESHLTNVDGIWAIGDVEGWSGGLGAAEAGRKTATAIVKGWVHLPTVTTSAQVTLRPKQVLDTDGLHLNPLRRVSHLHRSVA